MDSWEEEVSEMKAGSYKVVRIKSNKDLEKLLQKFDDNTLALVTYTRFLNRDSVDAIIKILLKYEVHMVLDESHRIKGAIRKNSADVSKTGKNIPQLRCFQKEEIFCLVLLFLIQYTILSLNLSFFIQIVV